MGLQNFLDLPFDATFIDHLATPIAARHDKNAQRSGDQPVDVQNHFTNLYRTNETALILQVNF